MQLKIKGYSLLQQQVTNRKGNITFFFLYNMCESHRSIVCSALLCTSEIFFEKKNSKFVNLRQVSLSQESTGTSSIFLNWNSTLLSSSQYNIIVSTSINHRSFFFAQQKRARESSLAARTAKSLELKSKQDIRALINLLKYDERVADVFGFPVQLCNPLHIVRDGWAIWAELKSKTEASDNCGILKCNHNNSGNIAMHQICMRYRDEKYNSLHYHANYAVAHSVLSHFFFSSCMRAMYLSRIDSSSKKSNCGDAVFPFACENEISLMIFYLWSSSEFFQSLIGLSRLSACATATAARWVDKSTTTTAVAAQFGDTIIHRSTFFARSSWTFIPWTASAAFQLVDRHAHWHGGWTIDRSASSHNHTLQRRANVCVNQSPYAH